MLAAFVGQEGALARADTAAGGQAPATISAIDNLANYVNKEEAVLWQLAGKNARDRLYASRLNDADPLTIPTAQQYLDRLSERLTTIQQLSERLVPLMTAWKTVLKPGSHRGVVGSEQALTDFALNGIALGDEIRASVDSAAHELTTEKVRLLASWLPFPPDVEERGTKIKLATCGLASSCFQHYPSFENIHRRDVPRFGISYRVQESLSLWLRQENSK